MATANPPRSSNRLPLIIIALVAVVGLIAGGVFLLTRNQPKKNIAANLPPFVIDRAPARGEEQATEAPITIAFDKPMNRASVESAFQITPKVSGAFKWNADDTQVQFVPTGQGFSRGELYSVNVLTTAQSTSGQLLGQPVGVRVQSGRVSGCRAGAARRWIHRHRSGGRHHRDVQSAGRAAGVHAGSIEFAAAAGARSAGEGQGRMGQHLDLCVPSG